MLAYLLIRGAELDSMTEEGNTALYLAAANGFLPHVRFLLVRGANVCHANASGATPLSVARLNGHVEIVELIKDVILKIVKKGNVDKLRSITLNDLHAKYSTIMLDYHLGKNKNNDTLLHRASGAGQLNMVRFLVGKGADLDAKHKDERDKNSTPLLYAAAAGYDEIVAYLLSEGADACVMNTAGCTGLSIAKHKKHSSVVKLLSEYIINAAKNGERHKLRSITAVDLAITDNEENGTPLHWASWNDHVEMAGHFADRGANLEAKHKNKTNENSTPLLWAAACGYTRIVRLLALKGADIHAANTSGATPLSIAKQNKHIGATRVLTEL